MKTDTPDFSRRDGFTRINSFTRIGGFTLIEVLVVIAITGLVSVLTLQMSSILLKGYDQISRVQSNLGEQAMRNSWFRDSIAVMMASLDEEFAFSGSQRSISGYTMSPLFAAEGELTQVQWSLESSSSGDALWYREHDRPPVQIAVWPETNASFAYRGQKSGWLAEWPAQDLPAGILPYRVKLSLGGGEDAQQIFAAIKVRRTGRYDYRDFFE